MIGKLLTALALYLFGPQDHKQPCICDKCGLFFPYGKMLHIHANGKMNHVCRSCWRQMERDGITIYRNLAIRDPEKKHITERWNEQRGITDIRAPRPFEIPPPPKPPRKRKANRNDK